MSSSGPPAELAPNLHRGLELGAPGQLPEVVNNRFLKRRLVLATQCFPEFPQKNLIALLRGDVERSFAATLLLIPNFTNFVIVRRHRRLLPLGGRYATADET
ncbi:MAG: hypothetical protein WBG02_21015 [Candidatus Acidiferrum sp.]